MPTTYVPCPCGSDKKFKFCCYPTYKQNGTIARVPDYIKFPISECRVLENWQAIGITPVLTVRELAPDAYVLINYLVDIWCLGVKDVFIKVGLTKADVAAVFQTTASAGDHALATLSYQDARSLILGAVDFAGTIGISPHADWKNLKVFVESELPYNKKFLFGYEGVPHYVSGPYDHENYNIEEVIKKVDQAGSESVILLHH